MKSTKIILPVLVILISVFLAYTIKQSRPDTSQGGPKKASKLKVEISQIEIQSFQIELDSFGIVQAKRKGEIHSLVNGQILSIAAGFTAGAYIKKGEVLLTLDPSEYQVAVQRAHSDLASAELAVAEEEARSEQARRDWSKQKNNAPGADYTLRVPQLKAAKASLNTARAQLGLAELNLERTQVKASYDGRIQETFVDLGAVVAPSNKLAEGYASDAVEIRLPLSNLDMPFINLPRPFAPTLLPTAVKFVNRLVQPPEYWQGEVLMSEAAIDETSQQLYLVSRIEDPFLSQAASQLNGKQALKIGQYLEASIQGKTLESVIVIPNETIYQGAYVYIVSGDDVSGKEIERKNIKIAWQNKTHSVISGGLEAGDLLVTTLLGQVTSSTKVEVINQNKENMDLTQATSEVTN